MNSSQQAFAAKIVRQRTRPEIYDFSYLSTRKNLVAFQEFAALIPADAKLLDVGCGFKPWRSLLPKTTSYMGVDYSSEWSCADALSSADGLPFRDNSFDAIICSEVLEHTRYPDRCIAELIRVCRPAGHIFISTPFAFPEHGVPYDFQRLTSYYYRDVFKDQQIININRFTSVPATGFAVMNFFVECTPLKLIPLLPYVWYTINNSLGLACDFILNRLAPRVLKDHQLYTHPLPLGFSVIVKNSKPPSGKSL